MSSEDRLGPIVRALVGVDTRYLGIVGDIANRLNSQDAPRWHKQFKKTIEAGLPARVPAPSPLPPSDTVIRVDRSIAPVYPGWVREVMHPELEATGPTQFDLTTIDPWLHDRQKNGGRMLGTKLYEYLKSNTMLEDCLGLRDGEEIQKKGIAVFRKFFAGQVLFLWKSVVGGHNGDLFVPCLYEGGGRVMVFWNWLGNDWRSDFPAARFAS